MAGHQINTAMHRQLSAPKLNPPVAFFLLIKLSEKAACLTLDVFLSGGVYSDTLRSILVVTLTRPIIRYSQSPPFPPNRYLAKLGGGSKQRCGGWRLSDAGLVPGV